MGQVNTMIGNVFRADAAKLICEIEILFVFFSTEKFDLMYNNDALFCVF